MLSFDSSLTSFLAKKATRAFWALRLYYNDESAFTGISDRTRILGGNTYFGSAQWGSHNQTLNINDFTTSNGTLTVKIQNAPGKFAGGRFSDLFSTNNYANRKWELYQCDDNADFHTDNLIAGGVISSDIEHDHNWATFRLIDYWGKYDIELPLNRVTNTLYPNAPEKNIDEPIPIWYGDFDTEPDVPAGSKWELFRVKGKAPAIIVEKGDTDENVHCLPDTDQGASVILNQLNDNNVFMYNQTYQSCLDSNVTLSTNPANTAANLIKFTGNTFFYYVPLKRDTGDGTATITDPTNIFDEDFTTSGNMDSAGANLRTFIVEIGEVKNVGRLITATSRISLLAFFGTFTGTPVDGGVKGNFYAYGTDIDPVSSALVWSGDAYQATSIGHYFTTEHLEALSSLTGLTVGIAINAMGGGTGDVDIKELGLVFGVESDKTYTYTRIHQGAIGNRIGQYRIYDVEEEIELPETEMVFISGKGREYGAWVDADSRNNGYNAGDLIENPTYIIEDILRNELGLASANIRYTTFDTTGNTTNGTLKDTFNENNTTDIKFAFSQPKIISSKRLIENICKQSGQYVWWSGITLALKSRKRTYTAVVATIDFKDVKILGFKKTPMNDVFNKIQVDYDFDYAANKTVKSRTKDDNASLEDGTSQGTGVSGYNQTLKFNLNMTYTLDTTTADNYGEALLAWLKDQRQVLTIETIRATYNYLEIGDIVNFSNWDSNLKIFGDTISTADGYMVTQITKFPNKARIVLTEVAGNIA